MTLTRSRTSQAEVTEAYPPGGYAAFLTNHDQNRTMDELGRNRDAAGLAATLLLTNPGIPFIYYGEELGLRGRKPDEEIRTPFPWDATLPGHGFTTGEPWEAFAPDAETVAVEGQDGDRESLLSHYRNLTRLRAEHSALRSGELIPLDAEPSGVYAFLRHDAAEVIAVVANLSDEPVEDVSLTLAERPVVRPDVGPHRCSVRPSLARPRSTQRAGSTTTVRSITSTRDRRS